MLRKLLLRHFCLPFKLLRSRATSGGYYTVLLEEPNCYYFTFSLQWNHEMNINKTSMAGNGEITKLRRWLLARKIASVVQSVSNTEWCSVMSWYRALWGTVETSKADDISKPFNKMGLVWNFRQVLTSIFPKNVVLLSICIFVEKTYVCFVTFSRQVVSLPSSSFHKENFNIFVQKASRCIDCWFSRVCHSGS